MNLTRKILEGFTLSIAVTLPMILFVLIHKEYLPISNEIIKYTSTSIIAIISLALLFLYILINRPRTLANVYSSRGFSKGSSEKIKKESVVIPSVNDSVNKDKVEYRKKHSLLEYVLGYTTILIMITVLVILLNLFIDRNSLSERQILLIVTIFSTSLATFEAFSSKTYIGYKDPFIGKLVKFIQISGGPPGIIKLLFFT